MAILDREAISKELKFKTVRSSGSGGQHVNKVATKVELYFEIFKSKALSEEEIQIISQTYNARINSTGVFMLSSGETRSQLRNKEKVKERLFHLLEAALVPVKERKATRIPNAVKRKRIEDKRRQSQKKTNRRPPAID